VSNVLNEEKQKQVIALGQLGWSLRKIEKATGVRRETAAGYLKAAGLGLRPPRSWGKKPPAPSNPANVTTDSTPAPSALPANPANEVTTDFAADSAPVAASFCEPFRTIIEDELGRGRNAMGIWQHLVDRHGFTGSYQSVKRFVRRQNSPTSKVAHPVIETAPGEEAQVDYGQGPLVRDPRTGKHRRTRLFVMTLGYSRRSVRLLTFHSSSRVWCELHQTAFDRLGGTPRIMVLDNLREGVLKPDIYDPELNPLYRDFLKHYNVVALPCRVADPDRKGKVESGVGHTQKTPLKGMKFDNLSAGQQDLDHWDARWANTRIHGTTKRQVATMFAEEKPALQPLPLEPFRFYEYGQRRVHLDGCVEIEAAYYSVPPGFIGQQVPVQWDSLYVRILHPATGQLLREHLHQQRRGRHRVAPEDRSPKTPPGVLELLARARRAGLHIGTLCETMHARQGPEAVRRIQGVLGFLKKYGAARVDEACAVANELEAYEYRFVRRYLERQARPPISLKQVDPLIRQLHLYRDLITERTQTEEPPHHESE
jgi:transposase